MWEEDDKSKNKKASSIDLSFKIQCECLPLDHAYQLSQAIQQQLPWFSQDPLVGLHLLQPPAEGNGWIRPHRGDSVIYLSKRTKLLLRLPEQRQQDGHQLTDKTLDMGDYQLKIGVAQVKTLHPTEVLFSHHVLANAGQSENDFLQEIIQELQSHNIHCRKILFGKSKTFNHPQGQWFTRSLMIADLDPISALTLQQQGLGQGRTMGFGLFQPHKGIKAVGSEE